MIGTTLFESASSTSMLTLKWATMMNLCVKVSNSQSCYKTATGMRNMELTWCEGCSDGVIFVFDVNGYRWSGDLVDVISGIADFNTDEKSSGREPQVM